MLWRWFQDWRDRRDALRDMKRRQRDQEALLMAQDRNPLNLAKLSLTSNPKEAASQWERACSLTPNAVVESLDSLEILLTLRRYDEAERLMRARLKRFPGDRRALIGLAQVSELRGDTVEALKRWGIVRSRVRDRVDGFVGCAHCLIDLGRLDEAETQLKRALRREPDSYSALVWRARISDRRQNWEESLVRWKHLAETHRDAKAFASAANALAELGRVDEAEAWLADPSRLLTNSLEIAVAYAELAQRRGDLTVACERWARVRAANPYSQAGYREGAECLFEAKRHAEADAVLRAAIERFPDELWPLRNFARVAHDRRDWTEAAARLDAFHQRFPHDGAGFFVDDEAMKDASRDIPS